MKKAALTLVAGSVLAGALGIPVVAAAAYEEYQDAWNDYQITGLPSAALGQVTGTVVVDGPNAVCRMTDITSGSTLVAPPWQFPITANTRGVIEIELCDGTVDEVSYRLPSALRVVGTLGTKGKPWRLTAESTVDAPITLTAVDSAGRPLSQSTAPGNGEVTLAIPPRVAARARALVATLPDGQQGRFPLMYQDGWSVWNPLNFTSTVSDVHRFDNCQTLTWSYSRKGQPSTAGQAINDVRGAFARLAKQTGLTFREVPVAGSADGEHADISIGWKNDPGGAAGTGGVFWSSGSAGDSVSGHVTFNSASSWAARGRPGFGRMGRGWLAVHEIMHAIGLEHVEDRQSIMYPFNSGQTGFTKGDKAGLTTLYPRNCASS